MGIQDKGFALRATHGGILLAPIFVSHSGFWAGGQVVVVGICTSGVDFVSLPLSVDYAL